MARAEATAARFQTSDDEGFLPPGTWEGPPALVINPLAPVSTLLAAVAARVNRIVLGLGVLAVADPNQDSTPEQMVLPSLRLAEEVELLLDEIASRVAKGGAA